MKLVVGNFKMNLLKEDIDNYIDTIKERDLENVVFCPSYIYLNQFLDNNLVVGSQDVSNYDNGAYTGDVSVSQLKSLGVDYIIIGHSERREYYDDSKRVCEKLQRCLNNNIKPILCIGESEREYQDNLTFDVLKKEIDEAFIGINNLKDTIIAYEPIWAIGTGLIPSNEEIYNTIEYIKKYVFNKYKININVLYGGSVSNKNINDLESILNIDGYLVGGCSTKVLEFIKLIEFVNK